MNSKLLAILFIIFGLLNVILLIISTITYFQLKEVSEELTILYKRLGEGIPNILGNLSFEWTSFIILLIVVITAFLTSILLLRKNKLFRIIGTVSSGLVLGYFIKKYLILYLIGVVVSNPSSYLYLITVLFSFVLLLILLLNWSKKLQIK